MLLYLVCHPSIFCIREILQITVRPFSFAERKKFNFNNHIVCFFVADQLLSSVSSWTTNWWWRVWNVQERETESKTARGRVRHSTQFNVYLTYDMKYTKILYKIQDILTPFMIMKYWFSCWVEDISKHYFKTWSCKYLFCIAVALHAKILSPITHSHKFVLHVSLMYGLWYAFAFEFCYSPNNWSGEFILLWFCMHMWLNFSVMLEGINFICFQIFCHSFIICVLIIYHWP